MMDEANPPSSPLLLPLPVRVELEGQSTRGSGRVLATSRQEILVFLQIITSALFDLRPLPLGVKGGRSHQALYRLCLLNCKTKSNASQLKAALESQSSTEDLRPPKSKSGGVPACLSLELRSLWLPPVLHSTLRLASFSLWIGVGFPQWSPTLVWCGPAWLCLDDCHAPENGPWFQVSMETRAGSSKQCQLAGWAWIGGC